MSISVVPNRLSNADGLRAPTTGVAEGTDSPAGVAWPGGAGGVGGIGGAGGPGGRGSRAMTENGERASALSGISIGEAARESRSRGTASRALVEYPGR